MGIFKSDEQKKKERGVYVADIECGNCDYAFQMSIPKGEEVTKYASNYICPNCGVSSRLIGANDELAKKLDGIPLD